MAVLISGRGSNMAALLEYANQPESPLEPVLVVADRDAPGLDTAARLGVDTATLAYTDFASKEAHEGAAIAAIRESGAELVCLAGFMRLLSAEFCGRFEGRLINIHPSLLPRHKGLNTHERALTANDAEHGCSVHFVSPEMDGGPLIAQARLPVHEWESAETLAGRVLAEEHRIYPLVAGALGAGLLELRGGTVCYRRGVVAGEIDGLGKSQRWPPDGGGGNIRLSELAEEVASEQG